MSISAGDTLRKHRFSEYGSSWRNLRNFFTSKFVFFTVFWLRCCLTNCLTSSSVNCWFLPRLLKSISIEKFGSSSFSSFTLYSFIEKHLVCLPVYARTYNHWRENSSRAYVTTGKQSGILPVAYCPLLIAEYATAFLAFDLLYFQFSMG